MLDPNFYLIAAKPDNVPIVAMIFLLGFFTWVALRKAYLNDKQIVVGGIPWEKTESDEKLFTWPDLVYTEMLCMILLTIVMIVWSVVLRAPLEEAANPTSSPNPAKAPWYFLGLQEMLVYFDPWLAGVVLPTLIIVGLMAIPYIDTNPKGNGYYSFRERKWEIGDLPLRLPRALVVPDHHRHVPARPELELLRSLRVLGSEQARAAGQRRPLRADLGEGAAACRCRSSGSSARCSALVLVLGVPRPAAAAGRSDRSAVST